MRCLLLPLLAFCTGLAAPQASGAQKPNILFIAIDDQNDWIGCLAGHPQAQTPHLDRLAARGTLFTNAHCQSPLCNPCRTSLLTGLRPSTTGVYGLAPWIRDVSPYRDVVTLPQHLAQHGYRTYSTGKIYHGGYGRRKTDKEFHVLGPPAGVGVRPEKKLVDTPAKHPLVDWGVFPHRDEDKGDWKVASWAVEQLDTGPDKPFFLSVGFFLPHVPCYATQKWFDVYPEDSLELPPVRFDDRDDTPRFSWYLHWRLPEPRLKFLQEAGQWKNLVRSYLACTSFVDSQVGRVLDALHRNGYDDDTVVVLWSDHGFHLGEKLITGKNTLWDRSARVPLMFAGPGIAAGARCGRPAELLDIYPTLIELCGLPAKDGLEGHSLVPQLQDATAPRPWPAITTHNHDNHGVRSERWRYIRYADGSEELYDMRADPNEWDNLAADPRYAEVLRQHRGWLPKTSAKPAPGSAARILIYDNGKANWEGRDIAPEEPIPEL
ncbi:MAG: sulfatase [Pirellulales bacterium]|nr:sulfatase [Pirellulales bacterium]